LFAWLFGLGLFIVFQAGIAAAQLPACSAASATGCVGKRIGETCNSGFGTANCMSTSFDANGIPTCSCPDVDCSTPGSCFETKYGLGSTQDWDQLPDGFKDELVDAGVPGVTDPVHADFVGSYGFARGDSQTTVATCNREGEGGFIAVYGTWIFREKVGCDPLDTATNPSGCPVEMATDLNLPDPTRPPHFFSEARHIADLATCGFTPPFTLHFCELFISVASSGNMFGVGRRIPNPGGPAGSTRVVWDQALGSPGGAASRLCCNSDSADFIDLCDFVGGIGVAKYPLTPNLGSFGGPYKNFPDFIFDGNPTFPPFGKFEVDINFVPPGQRYGVCEVNRRVPCDCGANGASCGTAPADPCPGLDRDPNTAGIQPDRCDLRDFGFRLSPDDRLLDGSPNPGFCAGTVYVFRGTPKQDCLLSVPFAVNGDPGPDCSVRNFGPQVRPDLNCDGTNDVPQDLCPSYAELNMLADSDTDGRGDECQCGDANGDGNVTVADIVTTNISIFNPPAYPGTWFELEAQAGGFRRILTPLMDANNSLPIDDTPGDPLDENLNWMTGGEVNVSDIVQINIDIFNPKTARCGRSPIAGQ
jgi:hypothetical protein